MATIIVATHREYEMPKDQVYLPVQAGAACHERLSYTGDDTGENISGKNDRYCELTALYWGWKNLDTDILGLCHYRRYLGNRRWWKNKKERILTGEEIRQMLEEAEAILPPKRHYWIETRESQYIHAHHREDLVCTQEILKEKYPEYLPAWEQMLKSRSGHICNMFIMRKEHFDTYCKWLFDILSEAEKRLDITGYTDNDRRVFGFLGERLLDVWMMTKGIRYREAGMITLEKQHWINKGMAFIQRKIKAGQGNRQYPK